MNTKQGATLKPGDKVRTSTGCIATVTKNWPRHASVIVRFENGNAMSQSYDEITAYTEPDTRTDYYCGDCGSRDVLFNASATWSYSKQCWELSDADISTDFGTCSECASQNITETEDGTL